ncbi:MAG: NYN domain-containing protein [Elusimicrobia bacterium]|nr:NYN domain-containing protein [Elusimicrobiota bacterium]
MPDQQLDPQFPSRAENQLQKTREELKQAHITIEQLKHNFHELEKEKSRLGKENQKLTAQSQESISVLSEISLKEPALIHKINDLEAEVKRLKTQVESVNSLKRAGLFVDYENIRICLEQKSQRAMDPVKTLDAIENLISTGDRRISMRVAYLPSNFKDEQRLLIKKGYEVFLKNPGKRKNGSFTCNVDIAMALDVLERSGQLDVLVLATGDGDFLDLINFIRARHKDRFAFDVIGVEGSINVELMDAELAQKIRLHHLPPA